MKPTIIFMDINQITRMSKDELEDLLDKMYQQGVKDGIAQSQKETKSKTIINEGN